MKRLLTILLCAIMLASCSNGIKEAPVTTLSPLETVGIPDEKLVTTLETELFKVNIYSTYSEIETYKGSLEELVIPDSFSGLPVKRLAEYSFYGDEKLKKVTLPSGLIHIDNNAFEECTSLSEVTANEGLEVIDRYAFKNTVLSSFKFPSTLVTIGKESFSGTSLTEVHIPDGVSRIDSFAFYGCEKLKSVSLGKRVTRIGDNAFHNCVSLESMLITDTVFSIGETAFRGCSSLKKIFIPKHTSLGANALDGCPDAVIYTPKKAKSIEIAKTYGYKYIICENANKMTEAK